LGLPVRIAGRRAHLLGSWFHHVVATEDGGWTTGLSGLHPTWQVDGAWPAEAGTEIALGHDLAARLAARPGQRLVLVAAGARVTVRVAGIITAGGPEDAFAWAPLPLVQRLAGRPGQVERVWMSALVRPGREEPPPDEQKDPRGYERYMCTAYPTVVAADLTQNLPGAEVLPATERIAGEARIVTRLTLLMILLALAGLSASTLGMLSTMTAAVAERSTEIALLRALGASPGQLAALLLGETLLVALAGGAAGWWIGSVGAAAIRGASFSSPATYQPLLLPVALAVALGVGLLGTLSPLRLALRLDPAKVLRG
jgi:putative ABC transport system permease protein